MTTFPSKRQGVSDAVESTTGEGNASFFSALAPFYFELEQEIRTLNIDDFGIAPVSDAKTFPIFAERVRQGRHAGMTYLAENLEARKSPRSVLPEARSIVVVALAERRLRDESREATASIFSAPELQTTESSRQDRGSISGYATCLDYHDVLKTRLRALGRFFTSKFPDAQTRAVVDTAPLLEKDWAITAGLGFCGLNSLVVNPTLGSRFFLGELLVSIPFEKLVGVATSEEYLRARNEYRVSTGARSFDAQESARRCLSCRRCVQACPTNALAGDRTLDARKCLNYWTIENRDEIPQEIAQKLDGRLFGCDLCQRVCPHNAAIETAEERELPLDAVERLDETTFRRLFKKTPIFRARVEGLKRVAENLRREKKDRDRNETGADDDQ